MRRITRQSGRTKRRGRKKGTRRKEMERTGRIRREHAIALDAKEERKGDRNVQTEKADETSQNENLSYRKTYENARQKIKFYLWIPVG